MVTIRLMDIAAAVVGGALGAPVVALLALAIRLDSPGPALFRQARVGKNRCVFTCYKLRTMVQGTLSVGTHEASPASITRLGHWLRRLKLDELPQLWNVLRGEMSLVGPRPCLPSQVELIETRRVRGIYAVRPGITGPAQVAGLDMSTPVALADADAVWADAPNLPSYVKLILATVLGKGRGDAIRG
jgi:O-antigen biosynthesis protein WbqP